MAEILKHTLTLKDYRQNSEFPISLPCYGPDKIPFLEREFYILENGAISRHICPEN